MAVPEITRRETVTLLASGFAIAVLPVSAETITYDTTGLLACEIQIPVPQRRNSGQAQLQTRAGGRRLEEAPRLVQQARHVTCPA